MNKYESDIYNAGRDSGEKDKTACPYGICELRQRSYWLAGWHDDQIEKGTNKK